MKAIIIFDGICNFCDGYINFVIDHDVNNFFQFAPFQSEFARKILLDLKVNSAESIILKMDDKVYLKSDAILEICKYSPSLKWLYIFKIIPPFLRNKLYDLVAQHRYLIMGKHNECRLPTPALRAKFLS